MTKHRGKSKRRGEYRHIKNRMGPWVRLKKQPGRYGMVHDWSGDGPYEVQLGTDGPIEVHLGSNLVLVTEAQFERWLNRA